MSRKLIIMRGPSGSGKSTYVANRYPDAEIFSADDFWWKEIHLSGYENTKNPKKEKNGVYYEYIWEPQKLSLAHNDCMSRLMGSMLRNVDSVNHVVVLDNTNIHIWEYENYIKLAALAKYEVFIVEFCPKTINDIKLCARRNKHNVPIEVIARMCYEFEEDCRAQQEMV
jgi:predicted kinase